MDCSSAVVLQIFSNEPYLVTYPDDRVHDPGRAIRLASKAVELKPNVGNFWDTLVPHCKKEGPKSRGLSWVGLMMRALALGHDFGH